ncbi:S8 family serine peptidase [Candidatus Margulisiibacteriota bacterium]
MPVKLSKKLSCFFLLIVFLLSVSAYSFEIAASKFVPRAYKKKDSVPGELVVKFKGVPDIGSSAIMAFSPGSDPASSIISRAKITKIRAASGSKRAGFSIASNTVDSPGIYKLKFNDSEDLYALKKQLLKDPSVEYVEPNYIFQAFVVPNDPSYQYQWGLQKIAAASAWDVHKGDSDVVVAVIDTGVDYRHQDLASNIWVNPGEIAGNGIDDDNNGYIDDMYGWDFVDVPAEWIYQGEDGAPEDNDPMDFLGHGTHVAGIASGVTNNSIGAAGTSWDSRIMCLRSGYLAWDGYGYLDLVDAVEAIYYAADNGADIINMSWGSLYNSVLVEDAINYAHSKGCFMTASAGNVDSYDAQKHFYPAAYDHVVAVSATDRYDKISIWNFFVFSNFGSFVDLSAPGTSILSCLPGNSYAYESGTSMAAPFVAGAAALVKAKYPDWTAEQIEQHLKDTSDDIYSLNQAFLAGKLGAGRLNIQKALGNLNMAITYPSPSSILNSSTVIKGSANVNGFHEYKVEYASPDAPDDWVAIGDPSDQPVENGLLGIWHLANPDGQYYLKLTVTNVSGESFSTVSGINFGINGEVSLSEAPKSGPNPFDPSTGSYLFYYDMNNAATIDVYIYDISGTLIWQRSQASSPGPNRMWWNGVDDFGSKIGNGVYLYMIVAKDGGTRKIIGKGKIAVVKS